MQQYFQTQDGVVYTLDPSTGQAQQVSQAPQGASIQRVNKYNLPPALQAGISAAQDSQNPAPAPTNNTSLAANVSASGQANPANTSVSYDPTNVQSMQTALAQLQQKQNPTQADQAMMSQIQQQMAAVNSRQSMLKVQLSALAQSGPNGTKAAQSFYNALPVGDQQSLYSFMGNGLPGINTNMGGVDSNGIPNMIQSSPAQSTAPISMPSMTPPSSQSSSNSNSSSATPAPLQSSTSSSSSNAGGLYPSSVSSPASSLYSNLSSNSGSNQSQNPNTSPAGGPGYGTGGPGDQIQYYQLQGGSMYALDMTTNTYQPVSSIPAGAPTITWNASGLPPALQNSTQGATAGSTTSPAQSTSSTYNASTPGTTTAGSTPSYTDISSTGTPYGSTSQNQPGEETSLTELNDVIPTLSSATGAAAIPSSFLSSITNNEQQVAFYVNAMTYGGYTLGDVMQDVQRQYLASQGNTTAANMTIIDPEQTKTQYDATADGEAATNTAQTLLPTSALVGNIDPQILQYGSNIPDQLFQTLSPIASDPTSTQSQQAMEAIPTQMYELMQDQINATTEQDKAVADNNYNTWKTEIQQQYGITLSNNAMQAWQQVQNIAQNYGERGIEDSGMQQEDQDVYLRNVRSMDTNIRSAETNVMTGAQLQQLAQSGSPAEIQAFITANPQYASMFQAPAQVAQDYSVTNLMANNPGMTQAQAQALSATMIDSNGNLNSQLYQQQAGSNYALVYPSVASQTNTPQTEYQQNQVLQNSANAEQSAYSIYDQSDPYSALTTGQTATMNANAGAGTTGSSTSGTTSASNAAANISSTLSNPPSGSSYSSSSSSSTPTNPNTSTSGTSSQSASAPALGGGNLAPGQSIAYGAVNTPTTPASSTPSSQNNSSNTSTPPASTTPSTATTATQSTGSSSKYTGPSIVDYLTSVGQASDYSTRATLAAKNGITNYSGTADQNTQLLNTLRGA